MFDESYIITGKSIKDYLIDYATYLGFDMKIFNILVNSGEMSDIELIKYVNRFCSPSEQINEIYEIGKKLY